MKTRAALALAQEMELDLVEISPKADPPVCRIIDYRKFLYAQKKKQKEIRHFVLCMRCFGGNREVKSSTAMIMLAITITTMMIVAGLASAKLKK